MCSWVSSNAEESEGKILAALNKSHGTGRWEWHRGDKAGDTEQPAPCTGVGGFPCWVEDGLQKETCPVRMCKVVMAHDSEPAECHKFGAQSGFRKKKLSQ